MSTGMNVKKAKDLLYIHLLQNKHVERVTSSQRWMKVLMGNRISMSENSMASLDTVSSICTQNWKVGAGVTSTLS